MSVTGQKLLVGLLGLALFGSVLTAGYVDAQRHRKHQHQPATNAVLNPKLETGRKLYEKLGCLACHGVDGKGGVPNLNAQTGQLVPPVAFVAEGYKKEELRDKILKGVSKVEKLDPAGPTPPLYMPAYKELIADTDLELLMAYLKSLMPKGEDVSF